MTANRKLIDCAIDGDLEGVKQALESGADIHACNDYALRRSAQNGYYELAKYIKMYIKLKSL